MRKGNNKINRLVATFLVSMVACSALSQAKGERPSLLVGIVIDQLRGDYIEMLKEHFGEDGFNRLMRSGVCFENVDFKIPHPDIASGTAILYTGAYPNVNSITSYKVRNRATQNEERIFHDPQIMGNFTAETLSPRALTVSTFCDEARIASIGLSNIYSFAPDAQQAIIMAGHCASGAFWINDVDGKWSTSTFYKSVPSVIQARNYATPLSERLDTMSWRPLKASNQYASLPAHRSMYPFRYFYGKTETHRYRAFKQSALVNEEVTHVALECLSKLSLGKRNELDMVNIGLTAAPYTYGNTADYSYELQDTYMRLDRQIASILTAVDNAVGMDNAVVFVASTGYFDDHSADEPRFNVPAGQFYPKRAVSLLNMFLIAKYGNGEWLNGYYDGKFYFNRQAIKDANLDLTDMRLRAAEFLRLMSGVKAAYSLEEVVNNPVTPEANALRLATSNANSPDVYIEILPGWTIVNDTPGASNHTVRSNAVNTPVIICAPGIKAQKIHSVVDATFLAPTVARLLRIRSPNAACDKPLTF